MSVQASSSRSATKSIGAAVVGVLLTFAIFSVVMLSFLMAPLMLLGVAFLIYSVWRPSRSQKKDAAPDATAPGEQPDRAHYGFGAGSS